MANLVGIEHLYAAAGDFALRSTGGLERLMSGAPTTQHPVHSEPSCGWRIGFAKPGAPVPPPLSGRLRVARAVAGLAFLALTAWLWSTWACLIPGWLGVSHLVAAATGYRGCPELGAIPSLVLRRHVATVCGPWSRLDRWLESRHAGGKATQGDRSR